MGRRSPIVLVFCTAALSILLVSSVSAAPHKPQDTPEVMVWSGTVSDFTRVNTVIYWHSTGSCYTPPPTAVNQPSNAGDVAEAVTRISTIYASPDRGLYYKDLRATYSCNQYVFSRVVADDSNLYWVDATGLVKLSKNANPGDTPQVLSSAFSDRQPYQIAIDSQYIYLSRDGYVACGGSCFNPPILYKINKNAGGLTRLDCSFTIFGWSCPYAVNMKVDPWERYLYYIDTSGNLQQMDLSSPTSITQLAANVHSYFPEGKLYFDCGPDLCYSDFVFIGRGLTAAGNTHEIIRYNNTNASSLNIYTSGDSTDDVSINDITSDGNNIFFYEVRSNYCVPICFQTYTAWLFRSGRSNASGLANLYQYSGNPVSINSTYGLDTDGTKLYWTDSGYVKRLSNQATALPKSPMHVVGLEVTQGVQTTSNSVPLIRGKRTFVRVYVQSDDSTRDIPKVTARLSATWTGSGSGVGDWIGPANVYAITIKRNPGRQQLDEAFLFELPWDWVQGDNLQITAELNPAHNPEQSDNYVNNELSVGPFHLNPSPRLEVHLFEYSYAMSSTLFGPAYAEKFGNIDWIRRAYPVDESNNNMFVAGGGLHWTWTAVRDDEVANRIRYPSVPCENKGSTLTPNPQLPDCQNLRASAYVASQIGAMRDNFKNSYGDSDNTTYYGLIAGGLELRGNPPTMTVSYFPRGQDGGKNGAGPAGNGFLGWYAGHEVGHSVGLGHPSTAGTECGISSGDPKPTYPHAHIGSNDDTTNVEGFLDTPSYNYPRYGNANLAIGSQTFDMMAYCLSQWISDQNYVRIYKNLTGNDPYAANIEQPQPSGNWLVVYGSIISGTNTAYMDYLQHRIGTATIPPRVPGNYAIRLRDVNGSVLQDYAFTPLSDTDSLALSFGQVVTFANGTRDVRIVRLSDQQVLADTAISVNAPTISNVHVISNSLPATGIVTVTWSASDPDSDALKFDLMYSRDNGLSFQPLVLHTLTPTLPIDISALGGGTAKFRVVASDGFNTGQADSAPFMMANKPPIPIITLPTNGIHVHYGQVVNFSGFAVDLQDGMLPDTGLVWRSVTGTLGIGPLMTQSLLPPGTDVITLTATNSAGLFASITVTLYVDDNIDPDGPTMDVSPGWITWNINSSVTAPQTRTLTVSNFGTDSLTWHVSSDAGWLTVSKTTGNDGETLVATGNPSALKNGETRIGHLNFTTNSNGYTQTVQVPVSLIKGDLYQSPYLGPMPPLKFVYLPIVLRQH